MKKRLKNLLIAAILLPCMMLFAACGGSSKYTPYILDDPSAGEAMDIHSARAFLEAIDATAAEDWLGYDMYQKLETKVTYGSNEASLVEVTTTKIVFGTDENDLQACMEFISYGHFSRPNGFIYVNDGYMYNDFYETKTVITPLVYANIVENGLSSYTPDADEDDTIDAFDPTVFGSARAKDESGNKIITLFFDLKKLSTDEFSMVGATGDAYIRITLDDNNKLVNVDAVVDIATMITVEGIRMTVAMKLNMTMTEFDGVVEPPFGFNSEYFN